MQILPTIQEENDWVMQWEMIVQSTFIWANYLLPNSPYCMVYLWWETERENWSWSLLGLKGLNPSLHIRNIIRQIISTSKPFRPSSFPRLTNCISWASSCMQLRLLPSTSTHTTSPHSPSSGRFTTAGTTPRLPGERHFPASYPDLSPITKLWDHLGICFFFLFTTVFVL